MNDCFLMPLMIKFAAISQQEQVAFHETIMFALFIEFYYALFFFLFSFFKDMQTGIGEKRLTGRNDPHSGGANANGLQACVVGK